MIFYKKYYTYLFRVGKYLFNKHAHIVNLLFSENNTSFDVWLLLKLFYILQVYFLTDNWKFVNVLKNKYILFIVASFAFLNYIFQDIFLIFRLCFKNRDKDVFIFRHTLTFSNIKGIIWEKPNNFKMWVSINNLVSVKLMQFVFLYIDW